MTRATTVTSTRGRPGLAAIPFYSMTASDADAARLRQTRSPPHEVGAYHYMAGPSMHTASEVDKHMYVPVLTRRA
ncbi:hypothetical protein FA95DRAFT_1562958 [Auriscalpium vulgare]|uniref:Uncharacterized protein n=1 Tax=Auriscalpium vulgare TaxID=40419 RepID=A0ACB8RI05_9AGAM|nr:hypothetical protein FA95DRAFT_1562958 [Auriscalpium vulgare]